MSTRASLTPLVIAPTDVRTLIERLLRTEDPSSSSSSSSSSSPTSSSSSSTTLIVCSSREDFLNYLLESSSTVTATATGSRSRSHGQPQQASDGGATVDFLLEPSLWHIRAASTLRIAYCPTVQHLRAYLSSVFSASAAAAPRHGPSSRGSSSSSAAHHAVGSPLHTLALLNMVGLHRYTSEFTAQGIGRSLALAVEAAAHRRARLVVCECSGEATECSSVGGDGDDDDDAGDGGFWYDEQVPLLSRRALGSNDEAWLECRVSIRSIFARWCLFEEKEEKKKKRQPPAI